MKASIAGEQKNSCIEVMTDHGAVVVWVMPASGNGAKVWIDPNDVDVVCAALKSAAKEVTK